MTRRHPDTRRGHPHRPEAPRTPGLPADQGAARLRCRAPGADQPPGQARLPDPRRHPDHAARGGAAARRLETPVGSGPAPGDRLRERHRAPRHLGVQPLDHAAVEGDRALAGVLRPLEGGDDGAGPLDLVGGRREDLVRDRDLVRVDQGLAVEAAIAALLAFGPEARLVREAVVDAVEDVELVRPRGGERRSSARAASGARPGT